MQHATDDELIIRRVRLCDCGKPLGHEGDCPIPRTPKSREKRGHAAYEPQVFRDIRQALVDLELISHAPTATWDKAPRDASDEPGGNRPPGGDYEPRPQDLAERLDWYESYHHKNVRYFRKALIEARTDPSLYPVILEDIRGVVKAWRQSPMGQEPLSRADPNFKRYIATCGKDSGVLARRYGVSRRYINSVKAMNWSQTVT